MAEEPRIPPEYQAPLVLVGISVIALFIAGILFVKTTTHVEPIRFSSDEKIENSASVSAKMMIDVSGAVRLPGVYSLRVGSRVIDAITSAGGMTEEADTDAVAVTINQASILSDGAKVYIPIQGSETSAVLSGETVVTKTISINTASADQLDTLSGVGPVIAKKIIDNRPYTKLEDLVTKKAIGQSLFDKLKPQLTL